MSAERRRVAIVGGGPAGLTAAYRLQRAGASAVVMEAEPWVGGRTRTDVVDGFRVDAGAQLFGSMFTRVFDLVRELGLGGRLLRAPGRDALWRGGRIHEVVYGSVSSMLASGGLPLGTKMRLGTTYLPFLNRHSAALDPDAPERAAAAGLDVESIASWGRREMGDDFVEYLVYPQLAAYYGSLPEETSAGLYHILARGGIDVSLHALRGGMAQLSEALADAVRAGGGEVRLDCPVERVEVGSSRVVVTARGADEHFDAAVLAVPGPVALDLLRGEALPMREWLERVRYRPVVSLAFLLDRPLGVRFFGLSLPRGDARTVAAACVMENKGAALVPEGRGLVVALARPDAAPDLVEAEPQRILEAMLPDLRRAFPELESRVLRARLYRWPVGNPIFYPGYLSHLGRARAGWSLPNGAAVELAGDYLFGSSVEGAVTSGAAAAERLLARRPV